MVPMTGFHVSPNPYLALEYPAVYLTMGLITENVARDYHVSRRDQDQFALRSHRRAAAAQDAGKFKNEIIPLNVEFTEARGTETKTEKYIFDADEGVRRDTTLDALAALKPVFQDGGTITAGNSSQTSDGAAAVVVMDRDKAKALGLKPLVKMRAFAVGGVPPELMGIGPVAAIPRALKIAGLSIGDIDLVELNEAFAAQAVAVIRQTEMDEEKVNVNGGAVALGHPLGATGAKLTVQLINEMKRRKVQFGMVTMCIGGGMGAAGIFENLE
jgi:acetyl-CoA acyltransferase